MTHYVLEELVEGDEYLLKTTHPRVLYDELTECFTVDIGNNSWCEVYGRQRMLKAFQIAEWYDKLAV
jgi:hypothetical protein